MSDLLGGFLNPTTMGLLGLAQGFGQAAGPSRMPIPLGAAFGSAAGGFNEAMMNAQKLKLLAQQEQRLNQQNEIQRDQWNSAKPLMANLPGILGQTPAGLAGDASGGASPIAPTAGGLQANLTASESAGRPDVVNAQGYSGKYQFGAPLLTDIGMYTGGPNEGIGGPRPGGWGGAKWSGQFNIPGFPDVKTHADFLRNPDAQDAAYNAAMARNDKLLEQAGAYQQVGQTVGGVPVTREGLLKGAWLGGVGGVTSWLKSGGAMDRADPNGTKVSDYIRSGAAAAAQPAAMAGGGQPSAPADMGASPAANLTPTQMKAFNGVANKSFQQYSQLVNTAAAMTMNPFTKDMAPILMQHANKFLEVGSWQQQVDPATGRRVLVNVISGKVEAHPLDEQFTLSPGQSRFGANGKPVASLPLSPGTPTVRMSPSGPEYFDPNNPQAPSPGRPVLKPDEIQALPFQPGAQQQQPATPAAPGAATAAPPAPTATSQAEAFNTSMARRTGEEAFQREQGQTVAKTTGEMMRARDTAYDNIRNYQQFATLMKDFETGKFSGTKMEIGRLLQAANIPDSIIPAGVDRKSIASAETMDMITNKMAMSMIGPGGMPANNFSEADRDYVTRTVNNLRNTPGGNAKIMELAAAVEQRKLAIGNSWAEWRAKKGDSVSSFQAFEATEIPKLKNANPLPQFEIGQASTSASPPSTGFRILNVR